MSAAFVKTTPGAPAGFFAVEAAGLAWLAEPGVIPVVRVQEVSAGALTLQRLEPAPPSAGAARRFGAQLARLHDAGAPAFGFTPAPRSWFGPLQAPFEVPARGRSGEAYGSFGEFWADRLTRVADLAAPVLAAGDPGDSPVDLVREAITAVGAGRFDGIAGASAQAPSRLHGDLWSGNVMWTERGAVLIDPAAHGGHRLEDLAMLALFGAPHLEEIFAGYRAQHPLPAGWEADLPAHSFFGLLAHVHLFGAAYVPQTLAAARAMLAR